MDLSQIPDSYKSIATESKGLFKDNGSRFIAHAYPVETEEEVKEIVAALKKEYYDARHHVYAYTLVSRGVVDFIRDRCDKRLWIVLWHLS